MKLRRFSAYLIDYLFIFLLVTMISQIRILNPTYDEYIEAYGKYEEIYDDLTVDNINNIIDSREYKEVNYDLSRYSVSISIISLVVYFAYFVGFQKWNKNQTLGKKMFNLEVVSDSDKKVKWWQMIIREVVVYNLLLELLLIIFVFVFDYQGYWITSNILNIIASLLILVNAFLILFRKDGKGLHDILAKTKVVDKSV